MHDQRRTALCLILSALFTDHATAQDSTLSVGARLRLTPYSERASIVGLFAGFSGDTLRLSGASRAKQPITDAAFPLWDIKRMDRRIVTRSMFGPGFLGFLGGTVFGTMIGSANCPANTNCLDEEFGGMMLGALIGTIVGAAVGSTPSERWRPAPAAWLAYGQFARGDEFRITTRAGIAPVHGRLLAVNRDTLTFGTTPKGKPPAISSRISFSDVASVEHREDRGSHARIGAAAGFVGGILMHVSTCSGRSCRQTGNTIRDGVFGLVIGQLVGSSYRATRWTPVSVDSLRSRW